MTPPDKPPTRMRHPCAASRGKKMGRKNHHFPPGTPKGGPKVPHDFMVRQFEKEYIRNGGNAAQAALYAGYAPTSAAQQGGHLLKRPDVQAYLNARREEIRAETVYDASRAMNEAKTAMDFALSTENANAFVKAVELRAKISGLLIDRLDARVGHFNIQIGGIDDPLPPIPVEVKVLPPPLPPAAEEDEDIFS